MNILTTASFTLAIIASLTALSSAAAEANESRVLLRGGGRLLAQKAQHRLRWRRRCKNLKVAQGVQCRDEGLSCPASEPVPSCGGPAWNDETQQYDPPSPFVPSCSCSRGKWVCQVPVCAAPIPDARCDCSPFYVAPGEFCIGEGATCPYRSFTCTGQFDEAIQTCRDVTVESSCDCTDGQFMCEVPACLAPDERCTGQ
jgi:hypothetical protein